MNAPSKFDPDPHKVEAFHHVLYEIEMFLALPIPTDPGMVSNALAESFLIHTRNLCDFFEKPREKDDIVSSDYGFDQSKLGVPDEIDLRFDKSLAHLTYSRLRFNGETKKWILDHFQPILLQRISAFLDHILSKTQVTIKTDDLERAEGLRRRVEEIRREPPSAPRRV